MMSRVGRSRSWRAEAAVSLAAVSAVLLLLLVAEGSSNSAQAATPIARAWGINSFGQLGDDSIAQRSRQVPVIGEGGVGSLGGVTELDGGQNHTVALKNGTAYAWGHNGSGQLGNGTSGSGTDSDRPVQVSGLTDVVAVAAGGNFSLALVSDGTGDGVGNDGTVWAWGDNFRGQLGHGIPAGSDVPVQVKDPGDPLDPNDDTVLENVVAVAAGSAHGLAVKSDGTVWTWGYDGFGQLGDTATHAGHQSRIPVQVNDVGGAGPLTGVADVSGGGLHSLALKSNGTLYAWGYNGTGGLGDGGGPDSRIPVQVRGEGGVGFLPTVTSIAAGGEHSLAIAGGTLYAWGLNNHGQVGNGSAAFQVNTPVKVKGEGGAGLLTGATDVAAGAHHSLTLTSADGTVWAWGRNEFGSLGNNAFGGTHTTPVQSVQVIGATLMASGDFHSLAVADADTTPPDTDITGAPAVATNNNSASFEFSSSAADVVGFQCRRDSELFAACLSPKDYTSLLDAQHTFQIRARDVAGNLDPSPANHTWTVDTVAPAAPSVTGPDDDSYDNDGSLLLNGTAEANSVVRLYDETDAEVGTTSADGSGNWNKTLGGVSEGSHTYTARATDAATNTSGPSNARTVKVDITAPTLDPNDSVSPGNGARNVSRRTNVTATFSENFEMDAATLVTNSTTQAPGAITLLNTKTGATVNAAVSCDDPCKTVTLNPSVARLAKRTTYRATIATAAEDLAGNALAAEQSWTFKTRRR
jgi:alpha-tubulin suppressor-like RCC1 family protein